MCFDIVRLSNVMANALNQKLGEILASVASLEWQML